MTILLLVALVILVVLALAASWRIASAPSLPDRLLAGDLTIAILTFILAVSAVLEGSELYLDAALVAAFLAFTSTIVLAKFIARGSVMDE